MMNKIKCFLFGVMFVTLASCGITEKVPLTGRVHRIGISDAQMLSLSNKEYSIFMASVTKSISKVNTQMVERVGHRLSSAVEKYLLDNGYSKEIQNLSWEFNLIQNNQANAFCMPGGKIVVYEGLLPYTKNESSLAIVLGHEIAHAVAKHGAEQVTKKQAQSIGTSVLSSVLNSTVGSGVGDIAAQAANGYFLFRNLKYSRANESEADYMGLIFAAMAGYNPRNAIDFWERMSAATQGKISEFLSDHPSDKHRIEDIKKWMPEAMKYYTMAKNNITTTPNSKKASSVKTNRSKGKH